MPRSVSILSVSFPPNSIQESAKSGFLWGETAVFSRASQAGMQYSAAFTMAFIGW